jgi:hypothetical protein
MAKLVMTAASKEITGESQKVHQYLSVMNWEDNHQ